MELWGGVEIVSVLEVGEKEREEWVLIDCVSSASMLSKALQGI